MQENKEFKHWKRSSFLGMEIINDYSDLGYTELTDGQVQEIYEAGQQSERDKHRWIPITERLPTEKDGKAEIDAQLGKYVKIFGVERESCIAREGIFFINGKRNLDTIWFTKWQPLPEV